MSDRFWGTAGALVAIMFIVGAPAPLASQAQTAQADAAQYEPLNLPWPRPRTDWTPPRTPEGVPDIQGQWANNRKGTPTHSLEDGSDPFDAWVESGADLAEYVVHVENEYANVVVDPPDGRIPYQPWAVAKREEYLKNLVTPTKWSHLDMDDRCLLSGVPRGHIYQGMQILQRPGYVLFLHNYNHAYRVIPTDGRPHLTGNIKLWMGDSRGRWEGNTLVIEVTNQNDKAWLDSHGSFHSDAMRVVERWTPMDRNTLYYEATIDDPNVFTRPWTIALTYDRNRNESLEQWEYSCYPGVKFDLMLGAGKLAKEKGETGIHWHYREKADQLHPSYKVDPLSPEHPDRRNPRR